MKHQTVKKYACLSLAAFMVGLSPSAASAAEEIIIGPSGTQTGTEGAAPDFKWEKLWGDAPRIRPRRAAAPRSKAKGKAKAKA